MSANPRNTSQLRLSEEVREIDEGLRRASRREKFKLEQKWAVRSRDFYRAILDTQPQIVHFSGHGAGENGIILEDETGQATFLEADALSSMFKLFAKKGVECVLLNACYSVVQAEAISQHINYVIGMNWTIGDQAAIGFAVAFYDALGSGEDVEFAFELGCSVIVGLQEHLNPVIKKKTLTHPTPTPSEQEVIFPNPYKGLSAFQEEDAAFFFGRELFITSLVQAAYKRSLVTVIGSSGSGKSSLVFAGLIPELRAQGNWLIDSFRPGTQPLNQLSSALVRQLEPELDKVEQVIRAGKLATSITQGEVSLVHIISEILGHNSYKRLLLVVDQFEELYTHCLNNTDVKMLLDRLLEAVKHVPFFTLVLTLRADFLGYALSYRPFADALQDTDLKLGPMDRQELQDAIERPAQMLGVSIEPGLTERILDAVTESPGSLPLLEFTLTLLWTKQNNRQLTHSAYKDIGGVKMALAGYAEEVYGCLNKADKLVAQRLLLQLVSLGEDMHATRRLTTRFEVGEKNWNLVARLATARLLITSRDEVTGKETVELVHEALIREWERLYRWVMDSREAIKQKQRIEYAAQWWKSKGKPTHWAYLLAGSELTEAKHFLETYTGVVSLSGLAKEFVEKSLATGRNNRYLKITVVSCVALLSAVATGARVPLSQLMESQAQELFYLIRGALTPTKDIVVLAIDDESISVPAQYYKTNPQQYAYWEPLKAFPFKREAYAQVAERLIQSGAKSVALDILFDTPSSYGRNDDEKLRQLLQRYGSQVALAALYESYETERGSLVQLKLPQQMFLTGSVSIGLVNFPLGVDGRIRELASEFPKLLGDALTEKLPSFDEAVLRAAQVNYPQPKGNQIHFQGPAGTFEVIPFSYVLDPQTWNTYLQQGKVFKDKIVLIGATTKSPNDYHQVAVSGSWLSPQPMSGVEIHANAIATLMEDRAIREAIPDTLAQGFLVFFCVGGAGVIMGKYRKFRLFLALGIPISWGVINYYMFVYSSLYLPTAVPVAAIFSIGIFYTVVARLD